MAQKYTHFMKTSLYKSIQRKVKETNANLMNEIRHFTSRKIMKIKFIKRKNSTFVRIFEFFAVFLLKDLKGRKCGK